MLLRENVQYKSQRRVQVNKNVMFKIYYAMEQTFVWYGFIT